MKNILTFLFLLLAGICWGQEPKVLTTFSGHSASVNSVTFSPDGSKALTGSGDNTAKLWDLKGNLINTFQGHENHVYSSAFSPSGTMVLTSSKDRTAKLWDLKGNVISTFSGHASYVWSATFSPDGTKVLTGSDDRTAKLWDLNGKLLTSFWGHTNYVSSATFSPDGTKVLTGSWDRTAKLWDLKGNVLTTFSGHTGTVWSVTFSPDGTKVLTASSDNTAKLWDLNGQIITTFIGHSDWVLHAVFTPDGSNVLTGSEDNTAKLWDINGNLLTSFRAHKNAVYSVSVSPDGSKVLTGSEDNTAKLWEVPAHLRSKRGVTYALKPTNVSKPKVILPPSLTLENVQISGLGANNVLDGLEKASITATVKNTGKGAATSLKPVLTSAVPGLRAQGTAISKLEPGGSQVINIPITAPEVLPNGKVELILEVKEGNKYHSDPYSISVTTAAFVPPALVLADYKLDGADNFVRLGKEAIIIGQVENRSSTTAKAVKVTFELPENVAANTDPEINLGDIKANGVARFEFHFSPNREYVGKDIKLKAHLSEATGKYGKTTTMTVGVNAAVTTGGSIEVAPVAQQKSKQVEHAGLTSDVDKDIPVRKGPAVATRYALIIGNENYPGTKVGGGLEPEAAALHAANDARSFKNYCEGLLGVPKENIVFGVDEPENGINQLITKVVNKAKRSTTPVEILFFYSGHGIAHDSSKKPLLLPIGVAASQQEYCVPVELVVRKLTSIPHSRVLVLLDACYSGAKKGGELYAMTRGTRMKPEPVGIKGNVVVVSSSSGEQASQIYNEQHHGFFTYELLKLMKEKASVQLPLKKLFEELEKRVPAATEDKKNTTQTPTILPSPTLGDNWQGWVWW